MLLLQLLLLGPNVEDQSLRLAGTAGADHTRRVTVAARQGPLLLSSGWVEVDGNAAGTVPTSTVPADSPTTTSRPSYTTTPKPPSAAGRKRPHEGDDGDDRPRHRPPPLLRLLPQLQGPPRGYQTWLMPGGRMDRDSLLLQYYFTLSLRAELADWLSSHILEEELEVFTVNWI